MSLRWSIKAIENYTDVCYQTLTEEEAAASGTTLEAVLAEGYGSWSPWFTPGEGDVERLANTNIIMRLRPLTHCFIWASVSVDLRGITEENCVEFWLRMKLLEKLNGPFLWSGAAGDRVPREITLEEVRSHIGLTANVSPASWREWSTRVMSQARTAVLANAKQRDERDPSWAVSLSQAAGDARDEMRAFLSALERHEGGEDKEEERQHELDHIRAEQAANWLGASHDTWRDIEDRLEEEAEMAEGE